MISVIVPNYNHAPYLKKRINSILNQTYQDFELIILDDFSTDNSKEIIEQYRNHRKISHIIYNKVNSGSTFKQWKKGIELAKGKYIWIAESDDYSADDFLEKNINSINRYSCDLSFSQSYIVDEKNNILNKKPLILSKDLCENKKFIVDHLLYGNTLYNASMVVFRKDAIDNNIWSKLKQFKYCGDWLFWYYLLRGDGRVSEVKEPLNYFRTHNLNVSKSAEFKGLTIFEGFSVSKEIFYYVGSVPTKKFCEGWYDIWIIYRNQYLFSKIINIKILLYFFYKQPRIAILEIKSLIKRLTA